MASNTYSTVLGVILQYMVFASFGCFLWLVKGKHVEILTDANRFPKYLHGCSHKATIQNGGDWEGVPIHTHMIILETAENTAPHILSMYHILPSKHPWLGACN